MPTTLVRATPVATDVNFYMFCKSKDGNHPVMVHPNVTTQSRVRIDAVNWDKPDSTYPNYDQPGDINTYLYRNKWYTKGNAINIGKRMADWQEYQGLTRDKGKMFPNFGDTSNRRAYAGSIFVQNWGTGNYSGKALLKDPRDAFVYDGTNHNVGFHANATRKSTTQQLRNYSLTDDITIADFAHFAFETLKSECDRRNLCYPEYLAWDWEDVLGPTEIIGYGNSYVNPSNPQQRSSVWDLMQADPRFNTEIVYEERFGNRWLGRTMRDAFVEAGMPAQITMDGTNPRYWFQGVNREFTKKLLPYYRRIWDRALNLTVYQNARRYFPFVQCGNYHVSFPLSNKYEDHYPDARDNFLRIPSEDSRFTSKRYLRADFQCPVCYSPNMSSPNRFGVQDYAPAAQVRDRNYMANLPSIQPYYTKHSFGDGVAGPDARRKIYRDINVQRVRACAANKNPTPTVPYIEPPFANTSSSDFGAANVHNPDESDILYILQQHYLMGVRQWFLFNPNFLLGVTDAQAKDAADRFVNVLNQFKAWIASR